jgi:hypothetical protein
MPNDTALPARSPEQAEADSDGIRLLILEARDDAREQAVAELGARLDRVEDMACCHEEAIHSLKISVRSVRGMLAFAGQQLVLAFHGPVQ